MKFYLAHPFDRRQEVRIIEQIIEETTGIELVNPFYDIDRPDVVSIDAGREERYENVDFVALVERDLSLIDDLMCDGTVAYMPGDCISIGTICEAWHTADNIKPVYIISEKHSGHPWVKYMAKVSGGSTFKTWKEFGECICEEIIRKHIDDMKKVGEYIREEVQKSKDAHRP